MFLTSRWTIVECSAEFAPTLEFQVSNRMLPAVVSIVLAGALFLQTLCVAQSGSNLKGASSRVEIKKPVVSGLPNSAVTEPGQAVSTKFGLTVDCSSP